MSEAHKPDPLLDQPWAVLDLGQGRAAYALKDWKCVTIRDVVALTEAQIMRIPGIGKRTVAEIRAALRDHGLDFFEAPAKDGTQVLQFPSVHMRLTRIEQRLADLERK